MLAPRIGTSIPVRIPPARLPPVTPRPYLIHVPVFLPSNGVGIVVVAELRTLSSGPAIGNRVDHPERFDRWSEWIGDGDVGGPASTVTASGSGSCAQTVLASGCSVTPQVRARADTMCRPKW